MVCISSLHGAIKLRDDLVRRSNILLELLDSLDLPFVEQALGPILGHLDGIPVLGGLSTGTSSTGSSPLTAGTLNGLHSKSAAATGPPPTIVQGADGVLYELVQTSNGPAAIPLGTLGSSSNMQQKRAADVPKKGAVQDVVDDSLCEECSDATRGVDEDLYRGRPLFPLPLSDVEELD